MKKIALLLWVVLLVIALQAEDYTPNELIIKTTSPRAATRSGLGLQALDNFLADYELLGIQPAGNMDNYFVVRLQEMPPLESIAALSFEGVELIEPNYLSEFLLYPDDPFLYEQYMDLVNVPPAWNITTGRKEILVAVVDSGTHLGHPDLQKNLFINQTEIPSQVFDDLDANTDGIVNNTEIMAYFAENELDLNSDGIITHEDVIQPGSILINEADDDGNGYTDDIWGWDFTDAAELANIASGDYLEQDNYPEDEYNHGTHVAGIIGATANNGLGIAGMCWDVKILSIRAGFKTADGLSGVLQDDDAAAGIIYAADMGADVINLSWGDNVYAAIIADACEYAYNQGSIVVVSAGNTASSGLMYPARLAHTISVGAVNNMGERFWQSSFGPYLDIMAPGVNVMSCFDNAEPYFEQMSGTSMSAPYVSGAIALLLSREPNLVFEQIRSRLADSAVDLGTSGKDDYYGNGLLNVYDLLLSDELPYIEIVYPTDNLGMSESFSIIGTVSADNFSKFSVMYSPESAPSSLDWFSVEYPHTNQPAWQFEEIFNAEIAWFDIPSADGEYLVKIEVVTVANQHYEYLFNLHIDQTAPLIISNETAIQKRYDGENLVNYLKLKYNEPVNLEVTMTGENGQSFSLFSSALDSLHYLALPLLQEAGIYSASIEATNICRLTEHTELSDLLKVDRYCIDYSSWQYQQVNEALVCLPKAFCYDGDETANDIMAMHLDENLNRTFAVWEDTGNGMQEQVQITGFAENFWLHNLGNIDNHYFEIVGVEANTAAVYSVNSGAATKVWSLNNSYGGSFIDYDADGTDDLALIQNVTLGNVTYRVLGLHKKFGGSWQTQHLIYNQTQTFSKNEFLNKVECTDLDGDGFMDILTADNDGDVIIYEQPSTEEPFAQSWTTRLPARNADYLISGNFRSALSRDFCAGAWNYDSKSAANTFSCFVFFSNPGINDQYSAIDTLYFDEYKENNAVTCADLDGDGDEEIILAVDPNLYIIDYVDTDNDGIKDSFIPVWKGDSDQHYPNTLAAVPATDQGTGHILANSSVFGERFITYIKPREDFYGPPSVQGFQIQVIDQNAIRLSWLPDSLAEFYRLYRKLNSEDDWQQMIIAETTANYYLDTGLDTGIAYDYRITAVSSGFNPPESLPTFWKTALTDYPPQLAEPVTMTSLWTLKIIFDQPLANTAVNTGHYQVNHQIGRPASVNFIHQKMGLLLTFHQQLPQKSQYQITLSGISSESGIILPETTYDFCWEPDTFPPRILSSKVTSAREAQIIFSEALDENSAENIDNFILTPPEVDSNNQLAAIQANLDKIILTFQNPLKASNQPYYLKISGIFDLAGNQINNLGNKTYFTLTDRTLENMVVYPNPFETGKYAEFRFAALPTGEKGELWIFDLAGGLVFNASFAPRTVLENYYSWDGKNNSGNKVSSGMYFYIMQIGESSRRGKIAVIN